MIEGSCQREGYFASSATICWVNSVAFGVASVWGREGARVAVVFVTCTYSRYETVTQGSALMLELYFGSWNGLHPSRQKAGIGFLRSFVCAQAPYLVTEGQGKGIIYLASRPDRGTAVAKLLPSQGLAS